MIVSQEIVPTHCQHLVKLLYAARQKCRIGPLAGAPPDTCAVVSRLNRDSSLKMTRLQSVTLQDARTSRHLHDVGSVVSVLADVPQANFGQSSPLWFLLMALDVWKEGKGVESKRCWCRSGHFLIARSSRSFVFLGRPDPPRRYTLYLLIHCCQHRATTISLRPRWRPIRLFDQPASLRLIIRPLSKSVSCSYCRRLRLRGIKSQYRLSKSSDSFG
ncbi:hypothetical protein TNCV_4639451 [Trichonephila clavipes]|nr:hypothetical protein TNCV_4639451 [Trichonephila clavipes]